MTRFLSPYNNREVVRMDIGERMKSLRQDRDIRQKEIAAALGLSRSAYSNYENGYNAVPLDILAALARYYHTSADYLLGLTDNPAPPQK